MVKQYGFALEVERCVQCHACEVACKSSRNIELGVKWRRVVDVWHGEYPDVVNRAVSLSCMHCGDPACAGVCPTGAISKRIEDGIVVVDQNRCIGCRNCFTACPFGVPQFGADGKMQKCDLCADRLIEGKEPACVATCPAEAIHYGTMNELAEHEAKRYAQKIVLSTIAAG